MPATELPRTARRLRLAGRVQGVGFRPFVYRLAVEHGVRGWVLNATGQVKIHAEADSATLTAFSHDLIARAPAIAQPELVEDETGAYTAATDFSIRASADDGVPDIHVPPDYFTCPDCLRELANPADRRHAYPFINCTQCGPRYTLITALPYDRPNTTLAGFPLCPACAREYADVGDRRFHAEPVACPVCGPHLTFVDGGGTTQGDAAALTAALATLRRGGIVAVKGVGGYHLMCDAGSDAAVAALRRRKPRPTKPLAVMFPADGRGLADSVVLDADARAWLEAPTRPIVLLPRRPDARLSALIAPGLDEIGVFLPYSPLHHLLLAGFGGPLVATSGNLSGEPVLTDNAEAQERLAHIADAFLHHNRPIARPADDPVLRPIAGRARPLRLGRGLTPLELDLATPLARPVLALGAHMKNAICLAWGQRAVLSPHIGELGAARSLDTLARVADDLQRLYQVRAEALLLDRHPGYGYRRWARGSGLPVHEIGHHRAHAAALAWEFPAVEDWIVFTWDGVGLGDDDQLWGGEAFVGAPGRWRHAASLRPFRLPGGEQAGRHPWRTAAALAWESAATLPAALLDGLAPDERAHLPLLHHAWQHGLNSPASSAAGRLFDAAAALIGVRHHASFEGEGPMQLEALAAGAPAESAAALPLAQAANGVLRADWAPLLDWLGDADLAATTRAQRFHAVMAATLVAQAEHLRNTFGSHDVGLSGGVFQNRLLTELAQAGLTAAGFRVHLPARVPVNDAGVSFGQVIEFLHTPT